MAGTVQVEFYKSLSAAILRSGVISLRGSFRKATVSPTTYYYYYYYYVM